MLMSDGELNQYMDPLYDGEGLVFPHSPAVVRLEVPTTLNGGNCPSNSSTRSSSSPQSKPSTPQPPYLLTMSRELQSPGSRSLSSCELNFDCSMNAVQTSNGQTSESINSIVSAGASANGGDNNQSLTGCNVMGLTGLVNGQAINDPNASSLCSSSFSFDYLENGKLDHIMMGSVWTQDTSLPSLGGYELTPLDYTNTGCSSLLDSTEPPSGSMANLSNDSSIHHSTGNGQGALGANGVNTEAQNVMAFCSLDNHNQDLQQHHSSHQPNSTGNSISHHHHHLLSPPPPPTHHHILIQPHSGLISPCSSSHSGSQTSLNSAGSPSHHDYHQLNHHNFNHHSLHYHNHHHHPHQSIEQTSLHPMINGILIAADHNWHSKPAELWDAFDVQQFLCSITNNCEIQSNLQHQFAAYTGVQLISLNRSQLINIDAKLGSMVYDALQVIQQHLGLYNRCTQSSTSGSPDPRNSSYSTAIDSVHDTVTNSTNTTTSTTVNGQHSYLGHLPSFSLLRNNCFELDSHGQSPSSVSESDRESTSSCMTAVNERLGLQSASSQLPTSHHHHRLSTSGSHPSSAKYSSDSCLLEREEEEEEEEVEGEEQNTTFNVSVQQSKGSSGRRGRPPKKDPKSRSRQGRKDKNNGKLWEFIRDLLLDPVTNPSFIRWERREDGMFKFVQSDKVAKLWGQRKQNPRMTYEKLSRAMRYYYKSQVLLPVFGRRLVYKFGPNATGWRPVANGF